MPKPVDLIESIRSTNTNNNKPNIKLTSYIYILKIKMEQPKKSKKLIFFREREKKQ